MAFEKSPIFNGEDIQQNRNILYNWISHPPRVLQILLGLLMILIILIVILNFIPAQNSNHGGLEGCVVNAKREAVSANVQIDGYSLSTYEDGCFFFPSLEPGEHLLVIQISSGQVLEHQVCCQQWAMLLS